MHPVTAPPAARPTAAAPDAWWLPALPAEERGAGVRPPPWVRLVERAITLAPTETHPRERRLRAVPGQGPEGRLLHPLWPLLTAADARFAAVVARRPGTAADVRAVWAGARRWLAAELTRLAGRTLVDRLQAARRAGTLAGADPAERFDAAMRALAVRPALGELLRQHPVLARLLGQRCLDVVAAAAELVGRLRADRPALTATLLDGTAPGPLVRARFGLGDSHGAARTVALLEFHDGRRLVYKPRPLGPHARWNEVLDWFAHQRPELAPRAVRLLPCGSYGWAEYVAAAPCDPPAEVATFYTRMGAQLALLYAVDAVDIHAENVIAAGAHPVVVDVETLFHPAAPSRTDGGHDPAARALAASVLRTAVLPQPLIGEHGAVDSSAIGGRAGQLSADELPAWHRPGTDLMRLAHRRLPWPGGPNRPFLAAAPGAAPHQVDPAEHGPALRHGFRSAYRVLVSHAAELTAPGGLLSRFAEERVRLVARPSQEYALALAEASGPETLRDLAGRRRAFAALSEDTGRPLAQALAPYELADLLDGDIPLFTLTPGSTTVHDSRGRAATGLLPVTGLDAVRAKWRRMGEKDLRHQEWLLNCSLATLPSRATPSTSVAQRPAPAHHHASAPVAFAGPEPPADAGPELALALATGVGDQLLELADAGDGRVNWLGLHLLGESWLLHPQGAALADGYPGTALFLAELGRATGGGRYLEAAAQAVTGPLPATLRLLAAHPELAADVGPGGFLGVGGLVHATARLAELLDSAELTAALPEALTALAAAGTACDRADVAEGLAGAALAAEAVHVSTGLAEAAELRGALTARCARLAPPAAAGFLWGRAGVALALGRGHDMPPAPDDPSWCSGLAGLAVVDRAAHRAHLGYLDRLADRAPLADHSLCHGELGVLEPLVEWHEGEGPPAHPAVARLLRQVERGGPRCGTPGHVPTPGLLTGLAGVGHGLLRLALGRRVPSVLLLRPGERTPDDHRWTTGAPDHRQAPEKAPEKGA
ncbi:type 2 lanthipeptide synthetase LanM family protein [Streptomyces profundus]|uniref:type 2 lanthipeptide synthetase LanM family protein n=1 Tax=Streptomyces profundus TaxID=2867410 RepID=UPI001D167AA9|nr:type 2 lanthipeptide synthetase LanM family protein [Streptomyces sp. MA3_2.13]UED87809.1 type 2 lantipeptide synthetase LanM family protein [Streptomyces sp. MA3_2.13]